MGSSSSVNKNSPDNTASPTLHLLGRAAIYKHICGPENHSTSRTAISWAFGIPPWKYIPANISQTPSWTHSRCSGPSEGGRIDPRKSKASSENEMQNEVYVAGLWLRDIHHGLLWEEHHTAAPCTSKAEEAPSWSWASLITLVRWPGSSKSTKGTFRVAGICFKRQRRHDIPDHLIFDGYRLRPLNAMTEEPIFNPTNMFPAE
jgi:hypothetical protein